MISVVAIRQRVAAAITAALGASGWAESVIVYDQFPSNGADNVTHLGFAVGTPRTSVMSGGPRQRLSEGVLVESTVSVRWAYNLAAKGQVTSYDAALTAEALLVKAVMGMSQVSIHTWFVSCDRTVNDQGWLTGDLSIRVVHQLALV